VSKRITLRGFIVSDFYPQRLLPIRAELAVLLRAEPLRVVISEFAGLDRAPEALATVFDRGSPYTAGASCASRRDNPCSADA
jgi:NADPH-dependent curcumin reductase CurA